MPYHRAWKGSVLMQYIVTSKNQDTAFHAVWDMIKRGVAGGKPVVVKLERKKRTVDQNAKMWSMLTEVSKQVDWYGEKLSPEDWKHVFTASLSKQRAVPGIDGGFVILGKATSKMTKPEMSDLIELIYAFGAEKGVKFNDESGERTP